MVTCPIVENENLGENGSQGGHVTIFWEFWDPLHISATVKDRNMKFGTQIDREVIYRKKSKFGSKGAAMGLRDHFREFWDPLHISATVEARNLKFGTQNDREVP